MEDTPEAARRSSSASLAFAAKSSYQGTESSCSIVSGFSENLKVSIYNDTRARNLGKVEDELQREHTAAGASLRGRLRSTVAWALPRRGEPWVRSGCASCLFGGVIIINAFFIGFETDYNRPEEDVFAPSFWFIAESVFLIIFTAELFLRLRADGLQVFWDFWNIFDLVLVLLGMVDTWLLPALLSGAGVSEMRGFTLFRLLRLVRVVRVLRILRLLRFIHELLMLAQGILGALKALGWAFLLMSIVLYVSAVFATEIIRDEFGLRADGAIRNEDLEQIERWFGSVGSSLLTLAQLMTLEGWPSVVRETALKHNKHWLLCFFVPFICCTNFALLNVVTAVVVEKIFEYAQDERVMEAKKTLKDRKTAIQRIAKLFDSLDNDGDGKLSLAKVKDAAENQDAMKQFQELGIARHDIDGLFLCLDIDGTGELSIAEFVEGCLRMHGPATSKDLLRIHFDVHRTRKALNIKKLTRCMDLCTSCLQSDSSAAPSTSGGRREQHVKTAETTADHMMESQASAPGRSQPRSCTVPAAAPGTLPHNHSSEGSVGSCSSGAGAPQGANNAEEIHTGNGTCAEDSAISAEQDLGVLLPPEAQALLEDIICEQQRMRQLLQVLGAEMRELRARLGRSGSPAALEPCADSPIGRVGAGATGPVLGSAAGEGFHVCGVRDRGPTLEAAEDTSRKPSSLRARGAGWGGEGACSGGSLDAAVAAVKISPQPACANSEVRRKKLAISQVRGWAAGGGASAGGDDFCGVVPESPQR